MTPGLVDKILARMTRRHDLSSALAARHHVMSTRWNFSFTKDARLGHKNFVGSIANQRTIGNGGRSGNRTHDRIILQPLSRRCPRLCRTSSIHGGGSEIRTRDGVNHMVAVRKDLSGQTPRLSGLPPQPFEMVGVPGNAPGLGTHLVRFRL